MSALADYQRSIRDLLKKRTTGAALDPHLSEVAQSRELGLLREIAVWWREMAVNDNCSWTAGLLRKYGVLHQVVESFYCSENVSSYVDRAGEQFLELLSAHTDPLIASLARFELAVMKVRKGGPEEYIIIFDRNPDSVFVCLKNGGEVPPADPEWHYHARVSHRIPGLVSCDRVPLAA